LKRERASGEQEDEAETLNLSLFFSTTLWPSNSHGSLFRLFDFGLMAAGLGPSLGILRFMSGLVASFKAAPLARHPDWSRRQISQHLTRIRNWPNPAGHLKDMAARTLRLKLEGRGWIKLLAWRQIPNKRMARRPVAAPIPCPEVRPVNLAPGLLPEPLRVLSRRQELPCEARRHPAGVVDRILALEVQGGDLLEKVRKLAETLARNSANSIQPPSSDGLAKPAPRNLRQKTGRKPGGQPRLRAH
jgi:hypothetical protein